MGNIDLAKVAELQSNAASAYALARNAYDSARTKADLQSTTVRQHDAAIAYRRAVAARESALGI